MIRKEAAVPTYKQLQETLTRTEKLLQETQARLKTAETRARCFRGMAIQLGLQVKRMEATEQLQKQMLFDLFERRAETDPAFEALLPIILAGAQECLPPECYPNAKLFDLTDRASEFGLEIRPELRERAKKA